jgi:hypothetical protein
LGIDLLIATTNFVGQKLGAMVPVFKKGAKIQRKKSDDKLLWWLFKTHIGTMAPKGMQYM